MRNIGIFFFLLLASHLACVQLSGLRQRKFSYYYYYTETWRGAQSFCREKHDGLITIRNETEILEFYRYQGWLGLYRENNTSPWKWSMKDKVATFFNWDFNEPDSNEHCAYKVSFTSKWRNDECEQRHTFMCYDESLTLVKENKTWEEALEHCRTLNKVNRYNLATLITEDDHDFAQEIIQLATTEEVWTGLRYLGDEWIWMGGEPVQYQDIPSCPAVRCGVLEKNSNSSFGIRDCNERRNFFCYTKTQIL
ncbi:secretory phospholipase A2 receptor-like isoform X1 [Poecilia formosa]|uniref:secretory phospholipase A2 receptor-like isoform X1 n=1 Tax=Poecilia formosa TaxID=48698 RepID=UPI0007BA2D31|nr:PREDICTED: secretory phospholipase A2 receptor-like isoform X1 [Poecilia formosa]